MRDEFANDADQALREILHEHWPALRLLFDESNESRHLLDAVSDLVAKAAMAYALDAKGFDLTWDNLFAEHWLRLRTYFEQTAGDESIRRVLRDFAIAAVRKLVNMDDDEVPKGPDMALLADLVEEIYPPEQELREEPPPPADLSHLTVGEIAQVARLAKERAASLGEADSESAIALFAAYVLPRFKWSWQAGYDRASIPAGEWDAALKIALVFPHQFSRRDLMRYAGVFQPVEPTGHYRGKWRVATFRLQPGAIQFESDAPPKPLHLRGSSTDRKVYASRERRWESFKRASHGEDGRAVPKSKRA